jgi:pimeloyl-ACP methyl ester carboxylesterase
MRHPATPGTLAPMKRFTHSGDVRIVFEDAGSGSPALVLIHGAFANRGHFASQVEHLARRHRVLAPDLRGHGDSDTPAEAFGICQVAEDVLAVCDAAGVERAVLCGHSWPVALHVVAARPELVAGVVLLDGVVLLPEELRAQILSSLVPVLEGPGWAEAMRGFLIGRGIPYDAPSLKARVAEEIGRGAATLAATMMRDVMSSDFSDELSSGDYPLLYVHGTVPADLARLRHLRPDALVACVAGAGHYMTLEVPEQVNAMLDRFLQLVVHHTDRGLTFTDE